MSEPSPVRPVPAPVPPAPLVSVLTAVYDPPREAFEDTVAGVLGQRFTDFEWVLVDDASPAAWVRPRLRDLAASDPRVRVVERESNGGIAVASAAALAAARGEFVAMLDHDDVLTRDALHHMARAARSADDVDYAYSDQDLMRLDGSTHLAYLKPQFSPERLRHHMYTGHLSLVRRALALEVGGFRAGFDGAQDHDLVLRVTERARRVVHVPHVLYHWREVPGSTATGGEAKPYAWDAGVRAVQEHLDRVGVPATVSRGGRAGIYRVTREPDLDTPVSVVIPTIGSVGPVGGIPRTMVVEAVRSMAAHTSHRDVEFVVVYDPPTPPAVLAELRRIPGARVRLVPFTQPFNFSAKCNLGALHATGEVLVFLNDDTEVRSPGALEQLITPLREEGVGMTGPKLLFEDTTIQHAGLVYGSGTVAHAYYAVPDAGSTGVFNDLLLNREASALTGACIAMRREVFEEVGGFCEALPVNYNDVDLCLKVRRTGRRLLWLHEVVLFHFESISRDNQVHPWEKAFLVRRWGDYEQVRETYVNNWA